MKLLTDNIRSQLLRNGHLRAHYVRDGLPYPDFLPVVKLFTPDANATWLLTALDPDAPDIAFGLCDLGLGYPELGTVSLAELEALRGPLGLAIERDLYFEATHTISVYAAAARAAGAITEHVQALRTAAASLGGGAS